MRANGMRREGKGYAQESFFSYRATRRAARPSRFFLRAIL